MTITELIKHLQQLKRKHGDLDVVTSRYSDYIDIPAEDVTVVKGIRQGSGLWIKRHHASMTQAELAQCKDFVYFEGN